MFGDHGLENDGGQQQGQRQIASKVYGKDFALNHLLKVSLMCEENREKEYKSPFYAFVAVWPMGKIGQKSTYLKKQHITFVMEVDALEQFGIALGMYASGQGSLCGKYVKWADPSKAANKSDETEITKSKNLQIDMVPHHHNQNEWVVRISFNRGKGGKSDFSNVMLTMPVYQAAGVANHVRFIASEARKMDFEYQRKEARKNRRPA